VLSENTSFPFANRILIGPAGAGKSTRARQWGRRLGLPVLDLDRQVERRTGQPLPQLFAQNPQHFRLHERAALRGLARHPQPYILATGGGAPLSRRNRAYLKQLGKVYFLQSTPQKLVRRLRPVQHTRPRYAGRPLRQVVRQDWRERLRYYRALANQTLSDSAGQD
jgi:Shikimate kinase